MTHKLLICLLFLITPSISFASLYATKNIKPKNKQDTSYKENHFATLNPHIQGYFDKYMLITSQIPRAPENAKVLFIETSAHSLLPKPSEANIMVLSDNKELRYYYSDILVNPAIIQNANQVIPKDVSLGDFLSSYRRYFSFFISKDHIFYNPTNYSSAGDISRNTVTLSSVLLESGIYSKFIRKNKPIRLLYRSYFDIDVYAFEQNFKYAYKALPLKIEVTIINTQNQQEVYHTLRSFDTIQQNILNEECSPENLYRKYNTIQMIRSAHWTNIDRMVCYNISIKAVGSSGMTDSLQFNLSFY